MNEIIINFLEKEYLWIIGIIISIIAILQTYRIHKINKLNYRRRNISLYYKVKSNFSLENIPEKLTVNYEDKHFNNIAFAEFILGNNGNVLLTNDDFVENIFIESDKPIRIISHKIIAISNDKNKFSLNLRQNENTDLLEFNFKRLSPKESIKFQLVYAPTEITYNFLLNFDYANESNLDSKVVRDVSFFESPFYHGRNDSGIGCAILLAYFTSIYYSFIYTQKFLQELFINWLNFSQVSSELISFFFAIFPAILITVGIYFMFEYNILKIGNFGEERQSPFGKDFEIN